MAKAITYVVVFVLIVAATAVATWELSWVWCDIVEECH